MEILFSFGSPTHCMNATSDAMLYKCMNRKQINRVELQGERKE